MKFYDKQILPRLLDLAMSHKELAAYRARLVPQASGRVLEIGIGSGLNLPFYRPAVERIFGLDPSQQLLRMAEQRGAEAGVPLDLIEASAEAIPLEDASIDCALTTWSLCSIPDPVKALTEIRRVLKPGGAFLFIEHGTAPDAGVATWQHRLTPVWKHLAGGCHLDRDMGALVRSAGFAITDLKQGYMRGPRPFTFMYEGHARPA